jgi:HEXXH motif-containing protein
VHEGAHLYLNTLMALDPLLENPMETASAPLRPDPRPLFQVLHATFVLGRNVRFGRRLLADPARSAFAASVEQHEEKYAEGYASIRDSGRFTDLGRQVFESLEEPRAG